MKTRLLKRLRREASVDYPYELIIAVAEMAGKDYTGAIKFAREEKRNFILRRVAELKRKRK